MEVNLTKYPSSKQIAELYKSSKSLEGISGKKGEGYVHGRLIIKNGKNMLYDLNKYIEVSIPENSKFSNGDLVIVRGNYSQNKLKINEINICAKCNNSFDSLKDSNRYTGSSLVFNEKRKSNLILRAKVLRSIREFLDSKGFIEVETPILQYHPDNAPVSTFSTKDNDKNHEYHLKICPEEFIKRLAFGFDRLYDLGRCFRNEESSKKHSPEFTMLEAYEAFSTFEDSISLTEKLIENAALSTIGTTKVNHNGYEIDLKTPWNRISVEEASRKFCGKSVFDLSLDELIESTQQKGTRLKRPDLIRIFMEKNLEPMFIQPTFLTYYPVGSGSPEKNTPGNSKTKEQGEAFIAKGIEIANVGEINNDPDYLEKHNTQNTINKFGKGNIEGNLDRDFLYEMGFGLPPLSGLGIGIDRLVMIIGDIEDIKETQAYPFRKGGK